MTAQSRSRTRTAGPAALTFRLIPTPGGPFGVVFRVNGPVIATYLPQTQKDLRKLIARRHPDAVESARGAEEFCSHVRAYYSNRRPVGSVDIDLSRLPDFQRKVLEACRRIPFGSTASYADLARAAGSPGAARAVGSAMARNPLPLIIPCHRVLRSDGTLGGFSSPEGTAQKKEMLLLENPDFCFRSTSKSKPGSSKATRLTRSRSA